MASSFGMDPASHFGPVVARASELFNTRHLVICDDEVMSVNPSEAAGAAHDETPPTAPAALSDAGVSTTVVTFIVYIAAWIGAKLTAFSVPANGAGGSDLSLLQLALFLLAGAAAIVTGRSLEPVPRSVFIVLTGLYSVASGLIPIAGLAGDAPIADLGLFSALTLFVFIADLVYPLIVAAALAVTLSRVAAGTAEAEDEIGRAHV